MYRLFLLITVSILLVIEVNSSISCPPSYNSILGGCYKFNNGTNVTWTNASQSCFNDLSQSTNLTGNITHLIALESAVETTALVYWMIGWNIQTEFWIDGITSSNSWNWSNQSITWYFNSTEQDFSGNASNYAIVYSTAQSTYIVIDEPISTKTHYICEFQVPCDANNSCLNGATCYLNVGRDLCICAPGYTGSICDTQIDECLSSPCQHGGGCSDRVNNYTCDCSNLFYTGPNCETLIADPTQSQRSAAFWSVLGVLMGLVFLLTLSDLPWSELASAIGCPWCHCKCISGYDEDDTDEKNNFQSTDESPPISGPNAPTQGNNYHVMNAVWNPDDVRRTTPSNPQSDSYRSLNVNSTPDNLLIQSFAAVVAAKQKKKQADESRVYAVDIPDQDNKPKPAAAAAAAMKSPNPTDTMVTWTQQLQEQLRNKKSQVPPRDNSASSTAQLIHSRNTSAN